MRESALAIHLSEQGKSFAEKLPGSSAAEVRQVRQDALARFALTGLPRMTDEQWRYTNIRSMEKLRFEFSSQSAANSIDANLSELHIQDSDMYRVVLVDGWINDEYSDLAGLPEGVTVLSLAEILNSTTNGNTGSHTFALQELRQKSKNAEHGFAALGVGFAADGVVVHVGSNVHLDKPLEILCVSRHDADSKFSNINCFIHAESGAKIQLIERYHSLGATNHLTNSAFTFKLDADAQVDHYRIQNESESAFHVGSAKTRQEEGSQYRIFSSSFGALLNRHEVLQSLDGRNAHCELKGLYIGNGNQHIDNYTTIAHESEDATSDEFYKGVLDDRARSVFHGRIKVAPGAQRTDAHQQNRNLILSPNAEADTKPQLEIYADDVKCSHGATVGQLDENAVFYLRSRGLDEAQARAVLTDAFAAEIVRGIDLEPVLNEVSALIQKKLNSGIAIREAA